MSAAAPLPAFTCTAPGCTAACDDHYCEAHGAYCRECGEQCLRGDLTADVCPDCIERACDAAMFGDDVRVLTSCVCGSKRHAAHWGLATPNTGGLR